MTNSKRPQPDGISMTELSKALARFGAVLTGDGAVRVRGVQQDSRRVVEGDLFIARGGAKADGAAFVGDALARGARAVLAGGGVLPGAISVPVLRVDDVAAVLSHAAEAVHGEPSRHLDVVGITGTNGKTTTAFLLAHTLGAYGKPAARLGTLGYACGEDSEDDTLTTPGADDVSRFLARARDAGAGHFVMEVSSHALTQKRVEGLRFAAAAFTNLTQDHLDYHDSMKAYGDAKARLFLTLGPSVGVFNADDPFGLALSRRFRGQAIRVGRDTANDVHPAGVVASASGLHGHIQTPSGRVEIASRLVGRHNLDNMLLCLGVVVGFGLSPDTAAEALSSAPGVPGRLERCDGGSDDVLVLVDYAHTPDALARVLEAVRPLTRGKVRCVFGCGGDRDPGKRPKMGDAVGRGADVAIVTSDNPRTEEPASIAAAIVPGLSAHRIPYEVELDRSRAIESAIAAAAPGDVVLIAGKGHEPYQILGTEKRPFDDRDEARRALARRRRGPR